MVVVAEEEMETEEDEADSKRHHVVHSMDGAVCMVCKLRRFFSQKKNTYITKQRMRFIKVSYLINVSFI